MSKWEGWERDDSPVNSDEEIEEMEIASLLHEFMQWQEIYGVHLFLKKRRETPHCTIDLTRSNAGAWERGDEHYCDMETAWDAYTDEKDKAGRAARTMSNSVLSKKLKKG